MKEFKFIADFTILAEDIDDVFGKLSAHFYYLITDEDYLEFICNTGTMSIKQICDKELEQ